MEEVTNLTIRDTSRILVEALQAIPSGKRVQADPATIFADAQPIDIGRSAVVERAAEILRKRVGWSRADAVEMAYDSFLYEGNRREWERTGEVVLLKMEGVARALCKRREA